MSRPSIVFDFRNTLTHRGGAIAYVGSHFEDTSSYLIRQGDGVYKNLAGIKRRCTDRRLVPSFLKSAVMNVVASLDPKAEAILGQLREQGMATALLSNDPGEAIGRKVLQHLRITSLFDEVVFPEDADGKKKPDPSGLVKIIKKLNADGTIFMVGDRASDMQVAVNASAVTGRRIIPVSIGIGSGSHTFLRASNINSYGCASNLEDVPHIVSMLA